MLINLNGEILPGSKPSLKHSNRSFRYGDSLFETMKMIHGRILFLQDHLDRVLEGAIVMGMLPRGGKSQAEKMLQDEIKKLLKQGRSQHLRIRLTLFRNEGGLYTPENTGFGFLIDTAPADHSSYTFNTKGIEVDIYPDMHKHADRIGAFKTGSSLIYVMASVYKKIHRLGDCLILNSWERPVEFTSSNLFILKKGMILTPPLSEGCIGGIMRKNLLEFFNMESYPYDEIPLTENDLHEADEIFQCNTSRSIQWISRFRDTRYKGAESAEIFSRFQLHLDSFLFFGLQE